MSESAPGARRVADGDPDGSGCWCDGAGHSRPVSDRREVADDSVRARVDLRDGVSEPADPAGRPDGTGADRDDAGLLGGKIEAVQDLQRLWVDVEELGPAS